MCYDWVENHIPLPKQKKILRVLKQLQRATWKKWYKATRLCMFCAFFDNYGIGTGHCENVMGNDAAFDLEMMHKPNDQCVNKPRRGVQFQRREDKP
jgi:hypothetical protein